MPHEVLTIVMEYIDLAEDDAVIDAWKLVAKWCLLASQMDGQGDSWLAFAVDAVTEGDGEYLGKWIEQWLDATMSTRPQRGPLAEGEMSRPMPYMPAQFVAELGKGVVLGLKALGPMKTPLVTLGGTTYTNNKQLYGEEDIAALMAFSNVRAGNQLQDIWAYFNTSRGKSIDVYRRQIFARMKQWSYNRRILIDTSIYLEGKTIKAIVDLKFNLGEGVAHICQRQRGSLSCRARGAQATKPNTSTKERKPLLQRRIYINLTSCSICPKELHGPQQITFEN
jgi:hypothetical protein